MFKKLEFCSLSLLRQICSNLNLRFLQASEYMTVVGRLIFSQNVNQVSSHTHDSNIHKTSLLKPHDISKLK